jgi:hypothetical protein
MHAFIQVYFLGVYMAVKVDNAYFFVSEMAANTSDGWKSNGVIAA